MLRCAHMYLNTSIYTHIYMTTHLHMYMYLCICIQRISILIDFFPGGPLVWLTLPCRAHTSLRQCTCAEYRGAYMSKILATSAGNGSANQYNSTKTVWIHRKSMVDKRHCVCILLILSPTSNAFSSVFALPCLPFSTPYSFQFDL